MTEKETADREAYMRRALALARQADGRTSPNPMVGCVVVKDGRIISEGFHEHIGGYHAERNALLHCHEDPAGAELYVTLEPCCHTGRTPPCTDIIIEKKIARVFVGAMDVNPIVAGKGVQILRDAGIEVTTGILEDECRKLNEVFEYYMTAHLPFVDAKYAMTLDGKIATASGDSKWVSGEASRRADADADKRAALEAQGVQVIPSELDTSGEIDLKKALAVLAEREIDGILLEGGGTLMGSMLKAQLINKVHAFVAPKIVGGSGAPSPVGGVGVDKMSQAVQLDNVTVASYGRDLCITGYPVYTE